MRDILKKTHIVFISQTPNFTIFSDIVYILIMLLLQFLELYVQGYDLKKEIEIEISLNSIFLRNNEYQFYR